MGLIWEGPFFSQFSVANVNREITHALLQRDIDVGLLPHEPYKVGPRAHLRYPDLSRRLRHVPVPVVCHVRHRWPPRFTRPRRGVFVLIQAWEFGALPKRWVGAIARNVDEVWAYSRYIRDVYVRSGIDVKRIKVMPLGVNPELFNPTREPARLRTLKSFKFLFVGGAILRKGFDVLLRAYTEEFTADDDVCLVVKDFFWGGEARADIRAVRRRRRAPEILYCYGDTRYENVARFYTACDAYVHPYRSEGFGLPIAEAMACGLPPIVPHHGAANDFCTDEVAYHIPAEAALVPSHLWGRAPRTVEPPTWFEPDERALRRAMRRVFENRAQARHVGARASAHIRAHFTWTHMADSIMTRLEQWGDGASSRPGGVE